MGEGKEEEGGERDGDGREEEEGGERDGDGREEEGWRWEGGREGGGTVGSKEHAECNGYRVRYSKHWLLSAIVCYNNNVY